MSVNDRIQGLLMEAGGKLAVKSALNPALWLCAITTAPAFAVMPFMVPVPWWLVLWLFFPITIAAFGFLFLLVKDRDKLQSEDYQIQKRTLELNYMQQSGLPAPVPISEIEFVPPNAIEGKVKK